MGDAIVCPAGDDELPEILKAMLSMRGVLRGSKDPGRRHPVGWYAGTFAVEYDGFGSGGSSMRARLFSVVGIAVDLWPMRAVFRRDLACARAGSLGALLLSGCFEPVPPVSLDAGEHDACSAVLPHIVDASASEIQCLVEDYEYVSYAVAGETVDEQGFNVPGPPVCCEVCATKGSADQACDVACKRGLCERAYDEHYAVGQDLDGCAPPDCGFNFTACMDTNQLHIQWIDLLLTDAANDPPYALQAKCDAVAADPVRADGLFEYLEDLDGIPGARGELANVEDVVGYCQPEPLGATDDGPPPVTTLSGDDAGADSSGTGTADGDAGGAPPEPPSRPQPCSAYAEQRFWVRPTNNFGTWNRQSSGVGVDAGATYPVTVTDGGIAYTLLPCPGGDDTQCLRIDQLAVRLVHPDSGLVVGLGLVQPSGSIPMSSTGSIDVPPGALSFAVRYEQEGRETLIMAKNDQSVLGHVDARGGVLQLTDITASSDDGSLLATMTLHADLTNTQPSTEIVQGAGSAANRVSLTALTVDAELDPIEHSWVIPRVGSWTGDHIEVELPAGRHAVILRADDPHRSRGIAAKWVEISPSGT